MSFSPNICALVSPASPRITSAKSSVSGCAQIPGGPISSLERDMGPTGRIYTDDNLLAVAQGEHCNRSFYSSNNPLDSERQSTIGVYESKPVRPNRSQFTSAAATPCTIDPSASTGTSSDVPHWITLTSTSSFVTAASSSSNREFSRMRLVPGVKIHIEFELIADLLFEDAQYIWSNAREQGDWAKFSGFVEAFKKHIAGAATVCTIMSGGSCNEICSR